MNNWLLLSPELIVAVASGVFLFLSVFKKNALRDWNVAMVLAVAAVAATLWTLNRTGELFYGTYTIDFFSQCFKVLLAVGLLLLVWLSRSLPDLEEKVGSEYFYLLFSAGLGFLLLTSSTELVTLGISLELSSVALYVMIPLRRGDELDTEAGIKYFLQSAIATGIFLYGASILFGYAQSTDIREIAIFLTQQPVPILFYVALVLSVVAFFFKLAVVPFHFWAPDVYQCSNTQITTLIATASKAVAVAILLRFLPLGKDSPVLVYALITLSLVTMTLGNLAAIWQKDMKRLLAYSSIAQAGYMLVGLLAMNESGWRAVFYYAATYLFTNIAVFMVVIKISREGKNPTVSDFAGLSQNSPLLALTLLLGLLSLAGIPPLVGFAGKWFLFTAAIERGYALLVLIAFINAVISLYYYLLVIKKAYMDSPTQPGALALTWDERAINVALIIFLVFFGVFPSYILNLGQKVISHVF